MTGVADPHELGLLREDDAAWALKYNECRDPLSFVRIAETRRDEMVLSQEITIYDVQLQCERMLAVDKFHHHFDIACPDSARLILFLRMEYQRSLDVLWRRPGVIFERGTYEAIRQIGHDFVFSYSIDCCPNW